MDWDVDETQIVFEDEAIWEEIPSFTFDRYIDLPARPRQKSGGKATEPYDGSRLWNSMPMEEAAPRPESSEDGKKGDQADYDFFLERLFE